MLILSLVFSDGVLVLSFLFLTTFSAAAEGTEQGSGILNLRPDFDGILALTCMLVSQFRDKVYIHWVCDDNCHFMFSNTILTWSLSQSRYVLGVLPVGHTSTACFVLILIRHSYQGHGVGWRGQVLSLSADFDSIALAHIISVSVSEMSFTYIGFVMTTTAPCLVLPSWHGV